MLRLVENDEAYIFASSGFLSRIHLRYKKVFETSHNRDKPIRYNVECYANPHN